MFAANNAINYLLGRADYVVNQHDWKRQTTTKLHSTLVTFRTINDWHNHSDDSKAPTYSRISRYRGEETIKG